MKTQVPPDDLVVAELNLKPGTKIMMMGSVEEVIQDVVEAPEDMPEVINDFDEDTANKISTEHREEYLAKVARVERYHKAALRSKITNDDLENCKYN